jgi:hypothetical protein
MRTAVATIVGISPYSQGRHIEEPKKDKESAKDHEKRVWRERLHVNKDGSVFIPPMAFKNCLSEAATYLAMQIEGKGKTTYTKHFEAGVLVVDPLVLPFKRDDVPGQWLFLPSDGKRGGGKRVDKCFPIIQEWGGDVTYMILDETITKDVFEYVLRQAGQFIGIGVFRPRNNGFYGRFDVKKVKWS